MHRWTRRTPRGWLAVFAWLLTTATAFAAPAAAVRPAAVAGLFYPGERDQLEHELQNLLDGARAASQRVSHGGTLRALIVPHAGYRFSGPVAARAFALLRPDEFRTVIVLAPSHTALLRAAEVTNSSGYATPLGIVPVSARTADLAGHEPFELHPAEDVQRPDWTSVSPRPTPSREEERAETWEHAIEVELPFLQKTLQHFELVPVVMGDADTGQAAAVLRPLLTPDTLLVVSSDLSHYHSYAEAQKRDKACVRAMTSLDVTAMERQEACGRIPILTLLHIAREEHWEPVLLDARNSGDTSGDRARVVGYAAVAFYAPAGRSAAANPSTADAELTVSDRQHLLALAHATLRAAAEGTPDPRLENSERDAGVTAHRSCFVTLTTRNGDLRGCIGHLGAVQPLFADVVENTRSAALRDTRFHPVRPDEVQRIAIEISVLTEPKPLDFRSPEELLTKLQPGRDGVVLSVGKASATYLPQVWEQIGDKQAFLDSLAEKAGLPAGAWRKPDARIWTYRVESFSDSKAGGAAR